MAAGFVSPLTPASCARVCVSVSQSKPLNVEYLMMDASVLLPPTGTPLTGIDFVKRLPCGDVEKTRRVRARSPDT